MAQADFTLTISRTGLDDAEAQTNLTNALGPFAKTLPGVSDIYLSDPVTGLILDLDGNPQFDRAKIEAHIASFFSISVDSAEISDAANKRIQIAAETITSEEAAKVDNRKPK